MGGSALQRGDGTLQDLGCGVASTHPCEKASKETWAGGGSALQRGDGTLRDLVRVASTHALREVKQRDVEGVGQHSSGAMERYRTWGRVASTHGLLQAKGEMEPCEHNGVSTPAGRWNVTGLDGRWRHSRTRAVLPWMSQLIERDGAAVDEDATTLRAQREGQHSSGAMERYRTWAGGGVYLHPCEKASNRAHRGWVSTPAGRWNVTGVWGVASTHSPARRQGHVGRGGSALQRGDGTLQDLVDGRAWRLDCTVTARKQAKTPPLRAQRKGQHSSGAMERYRTWAVGWAVHEHFLRERLQRHTCRWWVSTVSGAMERYRTWVGVASTHPARRQAKGNEGVGQHSSGTMERYRTWCGGGVYSHSARRQAKGRGNGWVSTPAGRWNVTGLGWGWRLLTYCEKASNEMWEGVGQHSSGAMERYMTWDGRWRLLCEAVQRTGAWVRSALQRGDGTLQDLGWGGVYSHLLRNHRDVGRGGSALQRGRWNTRHSPRPIDCRTRPARACRCSRVRPAPLAGAGAHLDRWPHSAAARATRGASASSWYVRHSIRDWKKQREGERRGRAERDRGRGRLLVARVEGVDLGRAATEYTPRARGATGTRRRLVACATTMRCCASV